ncbi:PepSY-associated TM helix domain-containing protein [Flavivirga jejuensis]|uniref:PepSY-associated TM helix domain-containing protein n=1 Tax=Flavivirga jejuensis TaxID=870487 RepID=A0ABT8WT07_9FLAO|nr:PepSY-associated TM helix domain-containing protein [Flavivirga jejuensis]MDO5976327.1 PepSY-associated TM helix domain-containing protein [Flavivirga jejuensis]
MNKVNYNRFFHLHTVTGIVISIGLYIIFFAGAFTLFWDEIVAWENASAIADKTQISSLNDVDIDQLIQKLESSGYTVLGRDISFYYSDSEPDLYVYLSASKDSLQPNAGKEYELSVNPKTYVTENYKDSKYSMGFLFYRLHYFYQLGMFGYYLAGLVSFFFLFAIVTGVIVHWKKIISNFYVFRPWAKLKTVWTDAHTVLGMIGLPFQFMYALTGAMFCLWVLVEPLENLFPEKETDKNTIEMVDSEFAYSSNEDTSHLITPFLDSLQNVWKGFASNSIEVSDYGNLSNTITVSGTLKKTKQFYHHASITYNFATNKVTALTDPNDLKYTKAVYEVAGNLHHAEYGEIGTWQNYMLKTIYFLLTLITCFVIITGVLIWLTARDKKHIPEKQRKFNAQVGYIYLALCLTLYPITALAFIVSKLIPESLNPERKLILYWVLFGGWLVASIFFWFKKNNYFTNKYTLLAGGVLGLGIPLVNGLSTGNWFWITFSNNNYDVFAFDMLWLLMATVSLYAVFKINDKSLTKQKEVKEGFKSVM